MTSFGRSVGVASGILGVLSVFAELCFRFPHHLVYNDARPFYAANIAVFRGLLLATIVATFVLGCIGVLAGKGSKHGIAGLILGTIAILLGGPNAEAVTDQPSRISAGLDYFILSLLVLGLLFIPMEKIWPLREQRIFRKGWQTDLAHFFTNHVGVQLLAFASMVPVQLFFSWAIDGPVQRAIVSQPLWLQFTRSTFMRTSAIAGRCFDASSPPQSSTTGITQPRRKRSTRTLRSCSLSSTRCSEPLTARTGGRPATE